MEYPLYLAGILALGIAAQWLAWRLKLPAIVLFLIFGFALGAVAPSQSGLNQELFFGCVSLAVGIILFEGGLTLNFREIQGVRGVVFRLVSVGLVTTWLLTAWLAHHVAGMSPEMAVLLGALLTVSGPTVIMPLLRQVQPARRIGSLMKWEGIVNDPIGAVLAALVFELILNRSSSHIADHSLWNVSLTLLTAILLSVTCAWLILLFLRKYWVPDYLQNPFVLAVVLLVFAISNHLQRESGLVTITLLGIILANQRSVPMRHIIEFKGNLRTLLISTLFIVLASRIRFDLAVMQEVGWKGVLFVVLLIAVVRPFAVWVSTIGSGLTREERILLAWSHPRGIVAAAVSSLFALELVRVLGPEDPLSREANQFVLLTFLVIVGTVFVYGLTLATLARRLGLSRENPQGVLFAGGSPAVRALAEALAKEDFTVLLVDTNPRNNHAARMAGLPVVLASIGSELIREETDLGGIGRLLAMTSNDEVNTLAAMTFAERFGRSEVYQVAPGESGRLRSDRAAAYQRGRTLFDKPTSIDQLEQRFASGQRIKKTLLSADFTYDFFRKRYGESALVLFRIDENGRLIVSSTDNKAIPRPGQKLISLVEVTAEGSGGA